MTVAVTLHDVGDPLGSDLMLFDMMEYGPMLRLRTAGSRPRAHLVASLKAAGLLRSGHQFAGALRLTIDVPIRGGTTATGKADLHVSELEDGLVITSASRVKMNLQRVLRARHRIPERLIALDGQRNFVKPTAECDVSDLEVQLEAMGKCIDLLRAAVIGSFPGCVVVEEQLLLRKAEVCHDLACSNAENLARATGRVPIAGSRAVSQTAYNFTTEAGRWPTWHFTTHKRGPVQKGYAKLKWLLRTELSCLHRDAIVLCIGSRTEGSFDFTGAVKLALDFYHAAGELCAQALDHVRSVSRGGRTMHQLLAALEGFFAIAKRQRSADGYTPSNDAAADAQRVINCLLTDGIVHATGLRKGTKVRDELERLVVPGGPLVRGATLGVYCLAPEYALALPGGQGSHSQDWRG